MRLTNRLVHLVAIGVLAWAPVAAAGPSGAIFTTNSNGTFVNGNVYDDKDQVYLNGGPRPNAPCTAAGLPDGRYVFQVTDPSGATPLSTDGPEVRQVRVASGVIVEYLGEGLPGAHAVGEGECDAVTVGLAPFGDTPNPGGEYKVWMTPVAENGTFEFVHSKSKTDNFKVVPAETPPPD